MVISVFVLSVTLVIILSFSRSLRNDDTVFLFHFHFSESLIILVRYWPLLTVINSPLNIIFLSEWLASISKSTHACPLENLSPYHIGHSCNCLYSFIHPFNQITYLDSYKLLQCNQLLCVCGRYGLGNGCHATGFSSVLVANPSLSYKEGRVYSKSDTSLFTDTI